MGTFPALGDGSRNFYHNPSGLTLASSAKRLSDLERDVESVRTTPGVQAVSVLFNTSDSINNMWLDSMIQSASQRAIAR